MDVHIACKTGSHAIIRVTIPLYAAEVSRNTIPHTLFLVHCPANELIVALCYEQ